MKDNGVADPQLPGRPMRGQGRSLDSRVPNDQSENNTTGTGRPRPSLVTPPTVDDATKAAFEACKDKLPKIPMPGHGGPGQPPVIDPAALEAWKQCMKDNGVADPKGPFPMHPRPPMNGQPGTDGTNTPPSSVTPPSFTPPTVDDATKAAFEACKDKLPVRPAPGQPAPSTTATTTAG